MSNFLDDIVSTDLTERTIKHGGKEKAVYFRALTVSEQLEIQKRVNFSMKNGQAEAAINMADQTETGLLALSFRLCDAEGNRVFKSLAEVKKFGDVDLINKLLQAMSSLASEDDAGND